MVQYARVVPHGVGVREDFVEYGEWKNLYPGKYDDKGEKKACAVQCFRCMCFFFTHRYILLDKMFVYRLKQAIDILAPIDGLIQKYQKDSVPISEIAEDFFSLAATFNEMEYEAMLQKNEAEYVASCLQSRGDFLLTPTHFLANCLDPRFFGDHLEPSKQRKAEELLVSRAEEKQADETLKQFNSFLAFCQHEQSTASQLYSQVIKKIKTPLQFWERDGKAWPLLRPLARSLFTLVPSSAACERNFSNMSFVHCKLRNRLSADRVTKLLFVRANHRMNEETVYSESEESEQEEKEEI